MCDIVNRAKELGIYTVVTDWYEDSPAKKLADKSYDISTSDIEAILSLIKDERIDGVFTGYIDSTLPYYYEICRRAGFPCYLNKPTLDCCTNKRVFKTVCRKAGVEVIPDADITDLTKVSYPVLIKPVDNSGSKGITVCCDEGAVPKAYERAMRFSKSKAVIAERFMDCDYVCAHYIVKDGRAELALLMDKDMNRVGRGAVPYPTAFVFPSRYFESYMEYAHPGVQRLVDQLEYKNGTFLISFFVNGRNFYAVEMAARLTATREYLIIKDAFGIDTLEMHISHALFGKFTQREGSAQDRFVSERIEESNRGSGMIYCSYNAFLKDGIIGKIEGIEEVETMHGVLNVLQFRDVKARIRADGSYGQLFCRIHLKAASAAEMVELVNEVEERVRVYSEEGRNMTVTGFDAERFFREI